MGNIITPVLPHDLPENWNDTQYVSPGGTEVGLTEKHGYNYLMKQVNNSQKAINELDAELEEIYKTLANKSSWSKNKIDGSVLDWAESQNIPTSGYAEPSNTDVPSSSYWLVNVLMSNAKSSWKVVVLHGITNNEVWYRSYNYGAWNAEWRKSLDDRTTPTSIGAAASSHEHSAGNITSGTFGVARGGTGKASVTSGSYLVGNGTGAMTEKTPAQVLSHIGAAASDHTHTPASIGAADASILGQIITAFGEIGVDDVTVVYATLCLKKMTATKCDLHISFKIESNTKDSSKFNFISFSKICSLLGITSVTASSGRSVVKFDPLVSISGNDLTVISRQTPGNMGYSGVDAILSTNGIGFGRYYKTDGSYGGWPLNNGLYDAGTYGQIDFYGADYSV